MVQIADPRQATVQKLYDVLVDAESKEEARPYLGASALGMACPRRLWYGFRWALRQRFDEGPLLRRFATGHLEEERLVGELRAAGVTVEGQQHEVVFAHGHGKGHIDGAVLGLEEAPKTWHILEIKTHNAKSYADVVKKGVKKSKPQHYVQMQMYMGLTDSTRGAYLAENKDNDELFLERVEFDKKTYEAMTARAEAIVSAKVPPEKISHDPAFFECKFCPFSDVCHGEKAPLANCRTCAHSTPSLDGQWLCRNNDDAEIPVDFQRVGCDEHRYIPAIVENILEVVDADASGWVTWENKLNKVKLTQPGWLSSEFAAAVQFRFIGSPELAEAKARFGAKVVPPLETGDMPKSDLEPIYGKQP